MTIMVIRETDGTLVKQGDLVTDFRGDVYRFIFGSRVESLGKSGKVVVTDNLAGQQPSHEYYASVFKLLVVTEDHCTDCRHVHGNVSHGFCQCGCTYSYGYGTKPMIDAGLSP